MRNLKKEDKNCWGGKVGIWMTTKPQREKKKNTLKWIWEKKKKKLRFEVSSPLKEIVLSFKVRNRTKFFAICTHFINPVSKGLVLHSL